MSLTIAELPPDERPRERLFRHGPQTLSDAELVALLLGSGTAGASAIDLARELLGDGLARMSRRDWSLAKRERGVGDAKAARLAAAFELGRRLAAHSDGDRDPVRDPLGLARGLVSRYGHYAQERLGAVFLDAKSRPIREREIYVGTVNSTTVSTRDILRLALAEGAVSVVIFHNHPSGDPAPSSEDILFTRQMVDAGNLLGVEVVDHLIIGMNKFVSLKQRGVIP